MPEEIENLFMAKSMIHLSDALKKMNEKDKRGVALSFDIVFYKPGTGEVIVMEDVQKCNPGHNEIENRTIGIKHRQSRNIRTAKIRQIKRFRMSNEKEYQTIFW